MDAVIIYKVSGKNRWGGLFAAVLYISSMMRAFHVRDSNVFRLRHLQTPTSGDVDSINVLRLHMHRRSPRRHRRTHRNDRLRFVRPENHLWRLALAGDSSRW